MSAEPVGGADPQADRVLVARVLWSYHDTPRRRRLLVLPPLFKGNPMSKHKRLTEARNREEFDALLTAKRVRRMDRIDNMPPGLRECVHEYGLNIVDMCLSYGVDKPERIRHLVNTILREMSPTRGSFSQQGVRTKVNT